MHYLYIALGLFAFYKGFQKWNETDTDALYEEARLNRIRVLNQQGDTRL
jgi:hypothetical protein